MLHFLANISNDSWAGHVGSYILLSFGPESAARIQQSLTELCATARTKGFDLEPSELVDFTARQIFPTGEDSDLDEVTELFDHAQESDDPVLVPERLLEEVLALAQEHDELKISRLPLLRHGSLECSVYLPNRFDGRPFLLDGGIDLSRLAQAAESEEVAAANRRHVHFMGVIADKAWQKKPGSSILIELGPLARAAVVTALARLQRTTDEPSADLMGTDLEDFSVRQVKVDRMDQLSGGVVGRFEQQAKQSPGPIAVPGDKMKHVLLLTDEYDELRADKLSVHRDGTLRVGVVLAEGHGLGFLVKGGIAVEALARA